MGVWCTSGKYHSANNLWCSLVEFISPVEEICKCQLQSVKVSVQAHVLQSSLISAVSQILMKRSTLSISQNEMLNHAEREVTHIQHNMWNTLSSQIAHCQLDTHSECERMRRMRVGLEKKNKFVSAHSYSQRGLQRTG